jgi:hypothetical protein
LPVGYGLLLVSFTLPCLLGLSLATGTNHPGGRAQVTVLTSTVLLTEGVKYGIGLHYHHMDPEKMPVGSLISYAAGFATILGAAWSKTSFAITLLRIASDPWSRWFLWFIIISVNVILGVSGLILWIQCWPVQKLWIYELEATCWPKHIVEHYQTFTSGTWVLLLRPRKHGRCEDSSSLTAATVYSGILDIVLALLPWKMIWKVTINKREKIGALVAMSMGVLYDAPQTYPLMANIVVLTLRSSSGIIAFLKIISLDDISSSSCKSDILHIQSRARHPRLNLTHCKKPQR